MRIRLVGVLTLLLLLSTGALVWERAVTPSDGGVVQLSNQPWQADAMTVSFVVGPGTQLRERDVVIRIDGRPPPLAGPDGSHVYTVRRDGRVVDVPVRTQPFALRAAVARNLAAGLFLLTLLVVALYVFANRPRDRAAQTLLITAALTFFGTTSWLLGGDALILATSGPTVLQILGEIALGTLWGVLLHFALILPGSELRPGRRLVALLYTLPLLLHAGYLAVALPAATSTAQRIGMLTQVSLAASTLLPVAGVVLTVLSYRSMRDLAAKRRVRWVLVSFYAAVAAFVGVWTVPNALGLPVPPENLIPVLFLPWSLALGAAVLRYRWFDIELIVRRSLLYGSLTACVLAIFLSTTWLIGRVVGPRPGVGALLASGLVALSAQPLLSWLRARVAGLVYGERADPYEAMAKLGGIDAAAHPQRVLQDIAESLAQTLRLRYVSIELGTFAAACGNALGNATHRDLIHGPEVLGRLVLETGSSRDPFGRADEQLLDTLVRQVGAAASAVLIGARLQSAREQLVLAREEERRLLHHRLHDGLGPALAANALQMEIACAQLHSAPEAADAVLRDLTARIEELRDDVHQIVNGQRPAVLDRLGLAAAIRDRAGVRPGLTVVESGDLAGLPAAVEVAAFWIALEAVHNATRHGGSSSCRVLLRRHAELTVEITDDGSGLPVPFRPGGGFLSMRERAEELGGRWSFGASPSGGTRVVAVLPLEPESQAPLGPGPGTQVPSGTVAVERW